MRRTLLLTCFLAFALVGRTASQDAVSLRPDMVKVEFENDQIRVLRVRYAAHQKLPMHSHPGRVVVLLTENYGRATLTNGTTQETRGKAGDLLWRDGGTHEVENLLDAPVENIEIEIKKATSPAVAVINKPEGSAVPQEPVPVQNEPHHRVVFQNQYVRVLDVFFPVGEASLYHTHSNDNVSVALSGDKSQAQPQGEDWGEAGKVVPGQVGFRKARDHAYTHRVRSAGKLPFHVIDVEIFP